MSSAWVIKEIYSSVGEGYDGASAVCCSNDKAKLFEYIEKKYFFTDSSEVVLFFAGDGAEDFPQHIDCTRKEAMTKLKKGKSVTVNIYGNMAHAILSIEKCEFV